MSADDLFPTADMMRVTGAEVLTELDRELALRRRVYPRWVAAGKLTASTAKRQVARMQAARNLLHNRALGPGIEDQTIEGGKL